jgi:hypothetical protein
MKSLFLGIALIIIVGFGGLVYRNAIEHPYQQVACPMDALVCPDGTSVVRTGTSCTFSPCLPPNVVLADINISFALPAGFSESASPDPTAVVLYKSSASASSTNDAIIIIRRYPITASSTALATIQQTAISGTSGLPVSATSLTSTALGNHRFTVASIERFEGNIDTAYYLARATDVLRFDAIDMSVANWTDAGLNITTLPAHKALAKLLTTLQGQ